MTVYQLALCIYSFLIKDLQDNQYTPMCKHNWNILARTSYVLFYNKCNTFEFDKDEIIEYVINKDKEIKNVLHDCDSLG